MRGHCLCGQIAFDIEGSHFKLYQCHCSLCRRQGGSLSNTAAIVPSGKFRWIRGHESISSWKKEAGFRPDCSKTARSWKLSPTSVSHPEHRGISRRCKVAVMTHCPTFRNS